MSDVIPAQPRGILPAFPPETWVSILGLFPNKELLPFRLISKAFRALVEDPSLWKTIDTCSLFPFMGKLLKQHTTMHIRKIAVTGPIISGPWVKLLAQNGTLQHLECTLDIDILLNLVKDFPQQSLKSVKLHIKDLGSRSILHYPPFFADESDYDSENELRNSAVNVVSISMSDAICTLLTRCTNIESCQIAFESGHDMMGYSVKFNALKGHTLANMRSFSLVNLRDGWTGVGMHHLLSCMPNVECLKVFSLAEKFTHRDVFQIIRKMPALRELGLSLRNVRECELFVQEACVNAPSISLETLTIFVNGPCDHQLLTIFEPLPDLSPIPTIHFAAKKRHQIARWTFRRGHECNVSVSKGYSDILLI